MKKMNNKGFSLVELIVVVLIMAIIAVALAPQVMKWVENSRKSNDITNYNALVEAANIAGTSESVISSLGTGSATVTFAAGGVTISNGDLASAMMATLNDLCSLKLESKWTDTSSPNNPPFTFTVKNTKEGIEVTKGNWPKKDYE